MRPARSPAVIATVPLLLLAVLLLLAPARAVAQWAPLEHFGAGGEVENYLRYLQSAGHSAHQPWSVRSFSAREIGRLLPGELTHPWQGRAPFTADASGEGRVRLLDPRLRTVFNSAFAHGHNDDALWAGRGMTTGVEWGLAFRRGPLSLVLAPVAFIAQNSSFDLPPNGLEGPLAFADGVHPNSIDLPRRFGDGPYGRLEPGQSTLRLDLPIVTAGISTASQYWGPAAAHPILLGNNAPGFLHAFLGSSEPLDLRWVRAHGRFVWGRLEQSPYSPVPTDSASRFMSGIVGVVTTPFLPGLEVGAARFFHSIWPDDRSPGLADFLQPLEGFLKVGLRDSGEGSDLKSTDRNQLASVFSRWVFPGGGLEVYGEFARNDHNWDLRDFILHPDHSSAYMVGFRKMTPLSGTDFWTLRGEVINSQVSHLARVRMQGPFYRHSQTRQGHTHRGQLLGSAAGYGGSGAVVGADYYHPGGRLTLEWNRMLRGERTDFELAPGTFFEVETADARALDVLQSLGVEVLRHGRRFDVVAGVAGVYNFNRYFEDDRFNLNVTLGVRASF
jgi:hypothetical protein